MAKSRHEDFAKFFENPTREGFREMMRNHVGELNQLDFKNSWPALPDLARHLLEFANSGGGCIVIGVLEEADNSLNAIGSTQFLDKANIHDGIKKFIPTQLKYEVWDFKFEVSEYHKIQGKSFQVVIVEDEKHYIPFISLAESGNAIRKNAIYVRHGTETEEATYQELQTLINTRIEHGYDSRNELRLENEYNELKMLYSQIDERKPRASMLQMWQPITFNPDYPAENFDKFIARMIDLKKQRIELLLKNKPDKTSD